MFDNNFWSKHICLFFSFDSNCLIKSLSKFFVHPLILLLIPFFLASLFAVWFSTASKQHTKQLRASGTVFCLFLFLFLSNCYVQICSDNRVLKKSLNLRCFHWFMLLLYNFVLRFFFLFYFEPIYGTEISI